jgi:integrase
MYEWHKSGTKKVTRKMVRYYKRNNKNGTSYQARIRIKGYHEITQTFKLKSEAQAWAEPIEQQMKNGTYKETPTEISINDNQIKLVYVSDLINYFRTEIAPKRYSYSEKYNVMYEWWEDKIGKIKVRELSASILSSCKQALITEKITVGTRTTTRSNNTINKYLMCMSAVLTYAANELELIDMNPMSKIRSMSKPRKDPRFLSDEEIKAFSSGCQKHSLMIYIFFLIALKTGGRFNEVRHLEVKDLDFLNNRVYFLNTKNKTHRAVHLDATTLGLIEKYMESKKIKSGYIFANDKKGIQLYEIKGVLNQIIKDAGIKNFRIHDIRHTTASIMAQNGATLLEIAEVLGQKSLTVTRNYSHLTRKHTEELLASIMDKYS